MNEILSLEEADQKNKQLYDLEKRRVDEAAKTKELDEAGLLDEESDLDLALHAVVTPGEASHNLDVARTDANAFAAENIDSLHTIAWQEEHLRAVDEVNHATRFPDLEGQDDYHGSVDGIPQTSELEAGYNRLDTARKALASGVLDKLTEKLKKPE